MEWQILLRVESESKWNRTNIFSGGIGIGIESNIIGLESELNWNRHLPELHIIGVCIKPSQTHGLIQTHIAMIQHCMGGS